MTTWGDKSLAQGVQSLLGVLVFGEDRIRIGHRDRDRGGNMGGLGLFDVPNAMASPLT